MKRKCMAVVIAAILLTGLCVSGCSDDSKNSKFDKSKAELGTDFAEEYYKLSVTDYVPDWDGIFSALIEDYDFYKDDVQISALESEPGESAINVNQLLTDGPAYEWWSYEEDPGNIHLWKYEDGVIDEDVKVPMQTSVKDYDKAKEQALEVAALFDADLVCTKEEQYAINDEIDIVVYDFQQQYEGTYIAKHVFVEVGNERLVSPSFYMDIDGNGMCILSVDGLLDVGEPLKTYQAAEFLSLDEVEKKIENYCASFETNLGIGSASVDVTVEDVNIVYIPYMENNEKVLIPAYEVFGKESGGTEDAALKDVTMRYVVDVFTGYVYQRGTAD